MGRPIASLPWLAPGFGCAALLEVSISTSAPGGATGSVAVEGGAAGPPFSARTTRRQLAEPGSASRRTDGPSAEIMLGVIRPSHATGFVGSPDAAAAGTRATAASEADPSRARHPNSIRYGPPAT